MESSKVKKLAEILAIPSKTGNEWRLIDYVVAELESKGHSVITDAVGNIFVTKGQADSYPLVMAHSDTVHAICEMYVKEEYKADSKKNIKLALKAYREDNNEPCGIGGDDKAGIFVCLELLEMFDAIKVFFPVQEETGCQGSDHAVATYPEFFSDVSYAIMFDSPENDTMSKTLMGTQLYDTNSVFFNETKQFIIDAGITKWQDHPYTDSIVMRRKFGFQTLNLAAGYYSFHSAREYVIIDDVQNAIDLGNKIISTLNSKNYATEKTKTGYGKYTSIFSDDEDEDEYEDDSVSLFDIDFLDNQYSDYSITFDEYIKTLADNYDNLSPERQKMFECQVSLLDRKSDLFYYAVYVLPEEV